MPVPFKLEDKPVLIMTLLRHIVCSVHAALCCPWCMCVSGKYDVHVVDWQSSCICSYGVS